MDVKQKSLFMPAFFLWFLSELIAMDTTLSEIAGNGVLIVSHGIEYIVLFLLLVQCIFFQQYSWKQLICLAVFAVPILPVSVISGDLRFATLLLLIAAGKNTEFDEIVRNTYYILLFMIPLIILLCLVGVLPDHTTSALYRGIKTRYSLGFSLPNRLGFRIFQLFSCHFYLRRQNLRFRDWIYGIAAILFIYLVPNFLTSCYCIGLLLALSLADRMIEKYRAGMLYLYRNALVLVAVLSNGMSLFLTWNGAKHGIWADIDGWISYRFSFCHEVLLKYGISLLGKNITGSPSLLLDNGYVAILIRFGAAVYLLVSISLLAQLVYSKKREPALFLLLVVLAIDGISQEIIFRASYNVFLLALGDILYEKQGEQRITDAGKEQAAI